MTNKTATAEFRSEIRSMIRKDPNVRNYIKSFEAFTGLKYSGKLTAQQLNDLILWCTNEQLSAERKQRTTIGGII